MTKDRSKEIAMGGRSRTGRLLVLSAMVAVALMVLILTGRSLWVGRYNPSSLALIGVFIALFTAIWNGAAWARWLNVALMWLIAIGSLGMKAAIRGSPTLAYATIGITVCCAAIALALSLPPVGAFQAARRASRASTTDEGPADDQGVAGDLSH